MPTQNVLNACLSVSCQFCRTLEKVAEEVWRDAGSKTIFQVGMRDKSLGEGGGEGCGLGISCGMPIGEDFIAGCGIGDIVTGYKMEIYYSRDTRDTCLYLRPHTHCKYHRD